MNFLEKRWKALWQRLELPCPADHVMERFRQLYGDRTRAYHNWTHLRECFDHLDEAVEDGVFFTYGAEECELALWFHDAIYLPSIDDNELLSARWMREILEQQSGSKALISRVSGMILCSQRHEQLSDDNPDERIFLDIDLAILGAPPNRFAEYEEAIRAEYFRVPDEIYTQKRREVMRGFCARTPIYFTRYFQTRLEWRARKNLVQYS